MNGMVTDMEMKMENGISGWRSNSSGPGCTPCRVSAPISTALLVEPGMPRESMGASAPRTDALAALSAATVSGVREQRFCTA